MPSRHRPPEHRVTNTIINSTDRTHGAQTFSLFKNFDLPEKMTLQFRAEVYKHLHTPNFMNAEFDPSAGDGKEREMATSTR